MSGIENKVIVITGASSGIGAATAILLAERGAKVILAARDLKKLEGTQNSIAKNGGAAKAIRTDVRDKSSVENLVRESLTEFGRIDVLVNNAGVAPISLVDDLKVDDWDQMIDINFRGVLYGVAAVLPTFRKQNCGHIVNVVSTSGLKITPTMAIYAATKNAVRTFTEGLRQEAGARLRVTGISPGYVKTDLPNSMTDPAIKAQIESSMEMAISPQAVAKAIAFAIEQPPDVEIGDIVIRPTAQD